jgi:hypothetical protein
MALVLGCTSASVPVETGSEPIDEVEVEVVGDAEVPALVFSHERGLYDEPFELTITSPGDILLTLDGTDPRAEGAVFQSPLVLTVDPSTDPGGFTAPAVLVRASAEGDNGITSSPQTHTYLFPGSVADLSPDNTPPGEDWPDTYATNNDSDPDQAIDYGIDPEVANDPSYADLLEPALRALPSISLVTDLENLFDEDDGIYMNAMEHGRDWERPVSFELLDEGGQQIQADAGLRIRGGWSRHSSCPKHALRLHFRSEYGPSALEFPLFGDDGAAVFDTFDLRTAQNYSWSFKNQAGVENTFLRDVFSRDAQLAMGLPSTRSSFVHLYLNGVYWGLYQTQERAEASFGETYLGGDKDDWDVVKVNGDDPRNRVIEATDGDLDAWESIWDLSEVGFENGQAVLDGLVDIDNLIDTMLVVFLTGNFDSPTGAFTNNKGPNNFFALYNRVTPGAGFVFFSHDSEHSMLPGSFGPGIGLYEDRVNLGTRTDQYRMEVSEFKNFHPQWLHHRLTASVAYRAKFNARVDLRMLDHGELSTDENLARIDERKAQIELAIVAESARWGDAKRGTPRTRDDDWVPAVDRLREDWVPYRNAIVLDQLEAADLYQP